MKNPLVSIIVPCSNSQATIKQCLESLIKQTYKTIEIIVVDRNSKDQTRAIAKRFTTKVFIHGPERSAQINFGILKAKGKYIYRVDSDFIVEPDVVKQCVNLCEKNKLDGIAVHNTSAEGLGFWADVRKFERNTYRDDNLIVAVRFFTKKSWSAIGGFDESLYGPEDYDFHNRFTQKKFRWGRISAIELHLGEPRSLSDIWKKHFFYGRQMVAYVKKHPSTGLKQIIPIRSSYLRHWKKLVEHPNILVGLVVMTVVKFLAGGIGFMYEIVNPSESINKEEGLTKSLYADLGWPSIFARIRFWTGSFVEIEKFIPREGKILDLGCGYGIFANYLAICSLKRKIWGIDTDKNKIKYADRGLPNSFFKVGDATKMRVKDFDVILLLDVLHHLNSYADQEWLISSCLKMLNSHGKLIIMEVNNVPLWKLVLGRTADAILYPGQPVYYRYQKAMMPVLQNYFGMKNVEFKFVDQHNPFPQILYICQKK